MSKCGCYHGLDCTKISVCSHETVVEELQDELDDYKSDAYVLSLLTKLDELQAQNQKYADAMLAIGQGSLSKRNSELEEQLIAAVTLNDDQAHRIGKAEAQLAEAFMAGYSQGHDDTVESVFCLDEELKMKEYMEAIGEES